MLNYSSIALQPSYSSIASRATLKPHAQLGNRVFSSVAIPSNMLCTINHELSNSLSAHGNRFYIMHRFELEKTFAWCARWIESEIINPDTEWEDVIVPYLSLSVGVGPGDRYFIRRLANLKPRSEQNPRIEYITVDVAHGHHGLVRDMICFVRQYFPDAFIIAGNIGTPEAVNDLEQWGADALKVGLSCGKACTTYNCTGVGTPMFSAILECANVATVPIIADGQVREPGDVCKALVAGATMVMIGSEFAACEDSPAKTLIAREGGHTFRQKEYFGSASEKTKGHKGYEEGTTRYIDIKHESYDALYRKINEGVTSCMSYAGVERIEDLVNMKWRVIAP